MPHGAKRGREDALRVPNWRADAALPKRGTGTFLRILNTIVDIIVGVSFDLGGREVLGVADRWGDGVYRTLEFNSIEMMDGWIDWRWMDIDWR